MGGRVVRLLRIVLIAAIVVSALVATGCSSYDDPALRMEGGCSPAASQFLPGNPSITGRISYCEGRDAWTDAIDSAFYSPGTRRAELMLAGYPANPGILLSAVSAKGIEVPLTTFNPTERWERATFEIPISISQEGFRIQLRDDASSGFGWAGMGASLASPASAVMTGALPMLAGLLLGIRHRNAYAGLRSSGSGVCLNC